MRILSYKYPDYDNSDFLIYVSASDSEKIELEIDNESLLTKDYFEDYFLFLVSLLSSLPFYSYFFS